RLHQHRFLGDPIWSVGFLRIAVPEVLFAKRDRSELRIGADGADGDDFFDIVQARLLNHLDAHHQVVIEEFSRIRAIRADAAHNRGQMNHDLGTRVAKYAGRLGRIAQVILAGAENPEIPAPQLLKLYDYIAAEKAGAAGNQNSL